MMGATTWYLHGQNNALLFEKEIKANGVTENRHYLQAAGMTFALVTTRMGAGVSSTASEPSRRSTQVRYFHQDHLGSMSVITNEAGQVVELLAYDPLIGRFSMGTASLMQKSWLVPKEAQRQAQQGPPPRAAQSQAI
jgi:uncharacterized protein RhaS with RHS repeats